MNGEKLQLIVYEKRDSRFCTLFFKFFNIPLARNSHLCTENSHFHTEKKNGWKKLQLIVFEKKR